MRLRLGTPRCLMVIAPHADDETIGAHGLIALAGRRGIAVRVVIVTDGAASHAGSEAWPRARLVRERRRETRRAMRRLGIGAAAIAFLNFPDGDLPSRAAATGRAIARTLRTAPRPLLIATPAADDEHPDHRVVAAGAEAAAGPAMRRVAYSIWPAGHRLPRARRLPLTAQQRLAKRHAIRCYRTQTGAITDDPAGFAMTAAQIASFSRPFETFVEVRR